MKTDMNDKNDFLERIFQELLLMSVGQSNLDDASLLSAENEREAKILSGLLLLHEELELYKNDLILNLEKDFQLRVLKRKNEELKSFNYAVSHDLQSPIRTINSFSKILHRKYADQLDEDGRTYLTFIRDSSLRMSELINGLLKYSRADDLTPFKKLDLNTLLIDVINDLQTDIDKSSATINIHDLPTINGCKLGIRQLFQNLVSNAIKFKRTDENLVVAVSTIPHPDKVIVEVRDNGIGIHKENLDLIFHIFSRLHTSDEYEGTGIGLSICKKIVALHNGEIAVDSVYGEGTAFQISFPKYRLH